MVIDSKITSSFAIMFFENEAVLRPVMEKLIPRVLYSKFECDQQLQGQSPSKVKEEENQSQLCKSGFNNFLTFFSPLSNKSPDLFKALLAEHCSIKTIKKGEQLL